MSYKADITPREAWTMLEEDDSALLVDVRTAPEWTFVGVPDLSALGRTPLFVSWQTFPEMNRNPQFEDAVAAAATAEDAALLFLCRSGGRSAAAASAMTAMGYSRAYNIAGGFEGDRDGAGHRGTRNGWKVDELPWVQG